MRQTGPIDPWVWCVELYIDVDDPKCSVWERAHYGCSQWIRASYGTFESRESAERFAANPSNYGTRKWRVRKYVRVESE